MLTNSAKNIFDKLINKKITISFCESATGGLLSSSICQFDNASKVFIGSLVTYSNYAKNKVANIDMKIINKYGAISYEVAKLMAKNTYKQFNTDITISVTGNSSENTMIEQKDTCAYYVCFYINQVPNVFYIRLKPTGDRNANRELICKWIFDKLDKLI